jgi:CRP-like cAMP-binding protein
MEHALIALINFMKIFDVVPNTAEKEAIMRFVKLTKVAKRTQLVAVGEVSDKLYFVVKGCIRQYYPINKGGENLTEITSFLFTENIFCTMFESFYTQQPSKQILETLEDCELLELSFEDYQTLLAQYPAIFCRLTANAVIERYINMHRMFSRFILESPEERYENFIKNHRELANRISQKVLASFIGISDKSLSRIKKRSQDREKQAKKGN